MCYLRDGPIRTLTDIRNTKAETVGAAQRVLLLQVVKARFALITANPHHVHLRSNRRSQGHKVTGVLGPLLVSGLTLQVQELHGSLLVLPARLHSQRAQAGKSLNPNAQQSQRRPENPFLHWH